MLMCRGMDGAELSGLGVCIQVVAPDSDDGALGFTGIHPLRNHDGNVHLHRFLPQRASAFCTYKVSGIDAHCVDHLAANTFQSRGERLFLLFGEDARGHRDTGQIGHLVCPTCQFLRLVCAGCCAQDEVEGIFRVDGEAANLGAPCLERPWYRTSFRAIAVERKRLERRSGQVDWIPF